MKGDAAVDGSQQGLGGIVAQSLRPVAAALAVLFGLIGVSEWLTPRHGSAMAALAAGTALAYLVLFLVLLRRPVTAKWAHPVAGLMAWLALGIALVRLAVDRDPSHSTTVLLVVVGAGAFLMNPWWLAVVLSTAAGSWAAIALSDPTSGGTHFVVALMAAVALSVVVNRARVRALGRLDRLHAYYRGLIEGAMDVAVLVDGNAVIRYVSPSVERMLGWTPKELLDRPGLDLVHPDDLPSLGIERLAERRSAPSRVPSFELRLRHRDGSWRWVEAAANNLLDDPSVAGIVVNVRDVTARKQAEKALREAEARYRTLIEQIPAVTYIDEVGETEHTVSIYVSPQVQDVLGLEPTAWLEEPDYWYRHLHPEDRPRVWQEWQEAVAQGGSFASDYRVVRDDGRVVWVNERTAILPNEAGDPFLIQGVLFDITEQKRSEHALRESEGELQRSLEILRRTDDERRALLARLMEAEAEERARMAEGIEDQHIQQMAAVGMRLEILRRGLTDPKQLGAVDRLGETVRQAIGRLRHLLAELQPRALELDGLSTALRQYASGVAADAGIEVSFEDRLTEEPDMNVRAIAYRIGQEAISNVALHASASRLEIVLEGRDGGVFVRLTDDGSGFAWSGHPSGEHLGLVSMKERAELAGGWFRIETAPGRGTDVRFWLPGAAQANRDSENLPRRSVATPSVS